MTGLTTERLTLREMTPEDFAALYPILSDPETMCHYPAPYDAAKVRLWIDRNLERYRVFGFGLWAVNRREDGQFLGDCGVTMQIIHGVIKPEIGYHLDKAYHRMGYGTEAAIACKDFVFSKTPFGEIYSYMTDTNVGSYRVAEKNGMRLVDRYETPEDGLLRVYAITRAEWEAHR